MSKDTDGVNKYSTTVMVQHLRRTTRARESDHHPHGQGGLWRDEAIVNSKLMLTEKEIPSLDP